MALGVHSEVPWDEGNNVVSHRMTCPIERDAALSFRGC